MSDHKTLCRLGLDALGAVDDKDHQVDDLGAPDDGLDKGGMPRTVHKGDLKPGVPCRLDLQKEWWLLQDETLLFLVAKEPLEDGIHQISSNVKGFDSAEIQEFF